MPTAESPFAVLTAVVAPALLTNSSTLLVLGVGNRIARVVDRTRTVSVVMATVEKGTELYSRLEQQARLLTLRARKLSRALRLGYAAVGGFAAETLVAVLGGVLIHYEIPYAPRVAGLVAFCIGVLSVGSMVASCVFLVTETSMALDNLAEEAKTVMLEGARRAGKG